MHTVVRVLRVAQLMLVGLLGACEQYELSDRALKMNAALGDAANRQVLLNAARASKRYPMYFTSVTQINTTGYGDGSSVGLTIPFGPGSNKSYSFAPSLKLQEGLTVQTAPLDTQDFYQGILTQVPLGMIGYYLSYGWSPQLVYYAFINEVSIPRPPFETMKRNVVESCKGSRAVAGDTPLTTISSISKKPCIELPDKKWLQLDALRMSTNPYLKDHCGSVIQSIDNVSDPALRSGIEFVNRPTDYCRFVEWEYFAQILDRLKLTVVSIPAKVASQAAATHVTDKDTNININIQNTATTGDASKSGGQPKPGFAIGSITDGCDSDSLLQPATLPTFPLSSTSAMPPDDPIHVEKVAGSVPYPPPQLRTNQRCDYLKQTNLVIRSPEALVFYMGELINAYDWEGKLDVHIKYADEPPDSLFSVRKNDPNSARAVVNVELDSDTYSYSPNADAKVGRYDQTMHLISLAEEVIDLQKKGTQVPGIPVVQLLGQ